MEKLPTIILPEGKTPMESLSHGCSIEDPADGNNNSRQGGTARSPSSRSSSGGLQNPVNESTPYVRRSGSFRSSSSHLLTAPVPAAGSSTAAPPAEAVPSLVRLTSVRLRACKPPTLAEDFYVRRIGMELLYPPVPSDIRSLGRSSSILSRRSPAQRSVASSRRNSISSKKPYGYGNNSSGGIVSSTPRTQITSSSQSSGSAGSGSSTTGLLGGDNNTNNNSGAHKLLVGNSDTGGREALRRSISSGSNCGAKQTGSEVISDDKEGSEYGRTSTYGRKPSGEEKLSPAAAARDDGKSALNKDSRGSQTLTPRVRVGLGEWPGSRANTNTTTTSECTKREEESIAVATAEQERQREKWEATAAETAEEYAASASGLRDARGATAAFQSPGDWPERKPGDLEALGSCEALHKAGSLRIEEEGERSWLLGYKKRSPYCVGCQGTGEAACAKPAVGTPSTSSAAIFPALTPSFLSSPKGASKTMECLYKQGFHELVLEIIPPAGTEAEGPDKSPKPYHHSHADVFSRLGFSVADVNAAQVSLSSHMVKTGAAAQFADINFSVTCVDTESFRLRLLQRLSEYNFVRRDGMQQQRHRRTLSRLGSDEYPPLGSQPLFHHVELRVRDPTASLAFYQRALQFRLISKQAIPGFRLTLYFLTTESTALPPQQAALDSHTNRSWLWEQSFSSICLKVYDDAERRAQLRPYEDLQEHECGFLGLTLTCKQINEQELLASLDAAAVPYSKGDDPLYAAEVYHLKDPDGIPLRILICDNVCNI